MSEMKDSNVKWIGKIPAEWSTKRVKYLATKPESLFIDGDWIESDVIIEEGIRYLTTGNVGAGFFKEQGTGYISEETFKKLKCLKVLPGDLMISRLNEPIGRACIVPDIEKIYVVAVDNVILRPDREFNKQFIMYCMNTTGYAEAGKDAARGSTMQRVSRRLLGTFKIPIANIEEQQLIVKYLNDKVEKTNEILKDLNHQIEILKKYKESTINEKMTYANHNGTEWKRGRIKDVLKVLTDYTANGSFQNLADNVEYLDHESYARLVRLTDLRENLNNVGIYVSEESYRYLKKSSLHGNEVLVANVGAYAGLFCIMPVINRPATLGPNMFLLKTNDLMINRFLYYLGNAKYVNEQLVMKAVSSAQPKLNKEDVKTIKIFIPPLDKQKQIVDYLDKKCKEIDNLIYDKQKQIEKMEQYKKSLIYEYVTGKKRVKGAEELYG